MLNTMIKWYQFEMETKCSRLSLIKKKTRPKFASRIYGTIYFFSHLSLNVIKPFFFFKKK